MSEEKSPFWRETSFKPGNKGNPGGAGHRNRDVQALARRYTVDSIRALVEVARLPAITHAAPKVAAAVKLLEISYPGIGKGAVGGADSDAARLHLLALQALAPPGSVATVVSDFGGSDEAEPVLNDEALIGGGEMSLLPEPDDTLPGEALPLWDSWKARRHMNTARDAELIEDDSRNDEATPDSGGSAPDSPREDV
jgi:hypothetical protein